MGNNEETMEESSQIEELDENSEVKSEAKNDEN